MKDFNTIIISFCFILLGQLGLSQSQDTVATVDFPHAIIAKRSANSVKLRWAPHSKGKWLDTRSMGVRISRAEIDNGIPQKYNVIAEDIRVIPETDLALMVEDPMNENLLAVGYAYYSEWESMNSNSNQWARNSDELDSKYLVLLYSCDRDFEVAEVAGLAYEDKSIEPNKNYAYRLEIVGDLKYKKKHKSVSTEIDNSPKVVVDQWEENEEEIIIAWSRHYYEKLFTGFYIERSPNGVTYDRMNEQPYVHLLSDDINDLGYISWSDSIANYNPHYYRIIGVDAFGDEADPSEPIKLMARDRTAPMMPKLDPIELSEDQKSMNVSWTLEDPADVEQIIIKKSDAANGYFKEIARLNSNTQSYNDNDPSILHDQYYKVCAVDTANNIICTYPKYALVKDEIPPAAPLDLRGTIDSNGVVTLVWQLGKEVDLYGYKVHVSYGPNRPFVPITSKPIKAAVYIDTLDINSLSEYIHYRITALDLRQNVSEYSKTIRLKKPDLIPPSPAVFKSYHVDKDYVELKFVTSSSKDIERHELLRKGVGSDLQWIKIANLSNADDEYVDRKISDKVTYSYRLIAIDDDGNITKSPQDITVKTLSKKQYKEIKLTGTVTPDGYLLSWEEESEVEKVRIYKSVNEKFVTFAIINQEENSYLVSNDDLDKYKIKIYYQNGSVSKSSNAVFNNL